MRFLLCLSMLLGFAARAEVTIEYIGSAPALAPVETHRVGTVKVATVWAPVHAMAAALSEGTSISSVLISLPAGSTSADVVRDKIRDSVPNPGAILTMHRAWPLDSSYMAARQASMSAVRSATTAMSSPCNSRNWPSARNRSRSSASSSRSVADAPATTGTSAST